MEAQAMGCIPITNPLWALADNVRHGSFLHGDANEQLVQKRYVGEIARWTRNAELQAKCRAEMMPWARQKFTWERVVDQYEALAHGFADRYYAAQFCYQLKHAAGKILNVGCNLDVAGFRRHGAVNVDLCAVDPYHKIPNPVDVIADARRPLPFGREFDTVILGDILEHMSDDDAVATLKNAAGVLGDAGRIVVTCPEDYRHQGDQQKSHAISYGDGLTAHHNRPIGIETIRAWLDQAELRELEAQPIDYGFCQGHGVLAACS
jgi:hypothetical protein